ncbi:PP2C family protein-serine/threonine phosphatase [Spirillospora sp. NPDC047279]|uniref:PP2C family protein-serine/threonine phosphatase n=1 Tax=Spirillospora sp. NPDC047279 TaxID=3155478 RepID=UPI0033DE5E94
MTEPTPGSGGLHELASEPNWKNAPHPVLSVDAAGVVAHANDVARLMLPVRPGEPLTEPRWLARAHAEAANGPVRGVAGARIFEACRTAADSGGHTVWWLSDVTEAQRLADRLAVERARALVLREASNELLSSLNLERCMEVTARLAARHLADAALVIMPKFGRRHPVTYCGPDGVAVREYLAVDTAALPGLAEALRGFPPVPSRWIDPAAAPGWVARRELGEAGAIVVIALPGHGVPAGALVLVRRRASCGFDDDGPGPAEDLEPAGGGGGFTEDEEAFARLFAARAGAAISAAGLYAEQASITDTLMRELLPPKTQRLDGVELAARYRPSGSRERIGGDFYDLHPAAEPEGEALVVLGDVCGKGLEAAVLTGKIRNTLQAVLPMADDHQRVLGILNEVLLNTDTTRYVTLALASVRRQGPQVWLRLTSAGHPPPLIIRVGGEVEAAATRGSLIGALDKVTSVTDTVVLEPGDTCLLYTDGITEARGGPLGEELFGEARLRRELAGCGGMPPEAVVERVHMLASQWAGAGFHDDMATIAITAPRRVHLSAVGGHGRGRFTA